MLKQVQLVESVGLRVERLVFAGLASTYAVMRSAERRDHVEPVLVVDLGASITNFVLWQECSVIASGVIPKGGDWVTSEIASRCGVSFTEAEERKIAYAANSPEQEIADTFSRELFTDLADRLSNPVRKRGFRAYLTGGSSQFPGAEVLAAEILKIPVYKVAATNFAGLAEPAKPKHSAVLGLLKYTLVYPLQTLHSAKFHA